MPIITVKLYQGRTREDKARLARKLTEATVEALGISADGVTILLEEVSRENWAQAGQLVADRTAKP